MRSVRTFFSCAAFSLPVLLLSPQAEAADNIAVSGNVVDLNGRPLIKAQVSIETAESHAGADVITVFAGNGGAFSYPEYMTIDGDIESALSACIRNLRQDDRRQGEESYGATAVIGLKDADLALEAAALADMPLPSTHVWRDYLKAAIERGDGGLDWAVMAREQARASGLET